MSPTGKTSIKTEPEKVLMKKDQQKKITSSIPGQNEKALANAAKEIQAQSPKLDKLVNYYLKCKKDLHKLQEKITELETHLNAAFDQHKIDQFSTALGEFKRIKIEGKYRWIIEV